MIVRIARWGRIVGGECRGRGLADDGGAGLLQQHHHRRIRARLMAAIDRRAHLGRHVRGVDDVLDADRDAAQRTFGLRARVFGAMGEGANGLFLGVDGRERFRKRRVGRQLALVDAAFLVGERDHGLPLRHARLLFGHRPSKTWMAGTSPAMTRTTPSPRPVDPFWPARSAAVDADQHHPHRCRRIDRLRLIRSDNIGPRTFRSLVAHFGSARSALERLPELARRGGARGRCASRRGRRPRRARGLRKTRRQPARARGNRLSAAARDIDDAPPLLGVRGARDDLDAADDRHRRLAQRLRRRA